jgi:hypothetical protein
VLSKILLPHWLPRGLAKLPSPAAMLHLRVAPAVSVARPQLASRRPVLASQSLPTPLFKTRTVLRSSLTCRSAVKPERSGPLDDVEYSDWQEGASSVRVGTSPCTSDSLDRVALHGTPLYLAWAADEYVVHDDAVPDSFQFNPSKRCARDTPPKGARAPFLQFFLTRPPNPLLPPPAHSSVKLKITPETLEKAARRAKREFICALHPCWLQQHKCRV